MKFKKIRYPNEKYVCHAAPCYRLSQKSVAMPTWLKIRTIRSLNRDGQEDAVRTGSVD